MLLRINNFDLLVAWFSVDWGVFIQTTMIKHHFLGVVQLRPLVLWFKHGSICSIWLIILLLFGKLNLLLEKFFVNFSDILRNYLSIAVRSLRICVHVLVWHLLYLLYLLLLHMATWTTSSILLIAPTLIWRHAVVSAHLWACLAFDILTSWSVQELHLWMNLVRGACSRWLVCWGQLLLDSLPICCLSRLLRVEAWVSYLVPMLVPRIRVDVNVNDSIPSWGGDLMLGSILVILSQLNLELMLRCQSWHVRENCLALNILELLIFSHNLWRVVEILRVLALTLALISGGLWTK